MKKLILALLTLATVSRAASPATRFAGDVVIRGTISAGGSDIANSKAVADFTSTTKGLLPPRMTTTQRDAISAPVDGLTIYNTTKSQLEFYSSSGSSWIPLPDASYIRTSLAVGDTTTTSSKALIDLVSTTKGFLQPRMTTTQRDAISSPPDGLTIFNTTKSQLEFYSNSGAAWIPLPDASYIRTSLAIGDTTTTNSKALLDLYSNSKTFLPPRMTTAERDLISGPGTGSVVFNTTTSRLNQYTGSAWNDVGTGVGGTDQSYELSNLSLAASVGSSALTISLKTKAGTDPSSSDVVNIGFRNSTATTGTYTQRTVTGALSITVSSGSTLGHASGQNQYVWVYAIDNAGTVELAVSGQRIFDEGTLVTTTAEGGGGAADSYTTIYSTTARTSVGVRLIGRLKSNQATAGTWNTAIAEISTWPSNRDLQQRSYVQCDTSAGWGAVNTKILRLSSCATVGSGITRATSSNNGDSFTINEDGMYVAQVQGAFNSTGVHGISVNSTQLTTSIDSITQAHRRCYHYGTSADVTVGCSVPMFLQTGDVVRPHGSGATLSSVTANTLFMIAKVGD